MCVGNRGIGQYGRDFLNLFANGIFSNKKYIMHKVSIIIVITRTAMQEVYMYIL